MEVRSLGVDLYQNQARFLFFVSFIQFAFFLNYFIPHRMLKDHLIMKENSLPPPPGLVVHTL
jgi:hypothetical protein